jgi:DNA-binding NarL/FixJ family response regulator
MPAPPVQYLTTSDGYNIAYIALGKGPPFVFMPSRLSDVQLEWTLPHVAAWFEGLSNRFQLIRYDSRGQGMSTRGLSSQFSLQDLVRDCETVVEKFSLRNFVLMAAGNTVHTAVHYALRNRDRVRALILLHASRKLEALGAFEDLARHNWELFLNSQAATGSLSRELINAQAAVFKKMTTQEDWLIASRVLSKSDVSESLQDLSMPTLVLHAPEYVQYNTAEAARFVALIPRARLALITGNGLYGSADTGLEAVDAFLAELESGHDAEIARPSNGQELSSREVEVLRLLAGGSSNREIAEALVISVRTVERHITHIYAKIGARGKADATAYALRHALAE